MEQNGFNFYNSENDGYRGGFGGYEDIPNVPPTPAPGEPAPPQKSKFPKKAVALLLACALVGGSAGVGGAALYGQMTKPETVMYQGERPQVETMANPNQNQPMTPQQLYAANLASCVGITVSTTMTNYYGQITTAAASGSGFVLTEDGYIVTNYHVIADAANDPTVTIEATFANGDKYPAKLVGGEPDNDIAVLKIEATGLQAVTLGDSDQLVIGEPVYTIGNPLGELTFTLTDGLVSALDRLITTTERDSQNNLTSTTLNVLQTNTAINPGNSGGPLFDSYGNVVGVVSAKMTQSASGVSAEGLGFAIPINDIKDILVDLVEHGYVTGKPYLGVQVKTVEDIVQYYGIPAGAEVMYVAEGSCAQKAGLQQGDIITALDDTAVDSPSALTAALNGYKAGDKATLTVMRQQQELKLDITFDEKNEQTESANQIQPQSTPNQNTQPNNPSFGGGNSWPFGPFFW